MKTFATRYTKAIVIVILVIAVAIAKMIVVN